MATYSMILALKIPWIEEPGRLQKVEQVTYGVAKSGAQLSYLAGHDTCISQMSFHHQRTAVFLLLSIKIDQHLFFNKIIIHIRLKLIFLVNMNQQLVLKKFYRELKPQGDFATKSCLWPLVIPLIQRYLTIDHCHYQAIFRYIQRFYNVKKKKKKL